MSESLNDQPEWHDVPQAVESLLIKYLEGDKSEKKHKQRLLKILKFYDKQEQTLEKEYKARLRDAEEKIVSLQDELVALQSKQDQQIKDAIARQEQIYGEEREELKREHKQKFKEVEDRNCDDATRQKDAYTANLLSLDAKHVEELKKLKDEHESFVIDLRNNFAVMTKSADELRETHRRQYYTMKTQLEQKLQDQAKEFESKIERLRQERIADNELAKSRDLELQQECKAELDEMEREYEEEIRAIQGGFAVEKKTMQDTFARSARDYADKIKAVREEAAAEKRRMKEEYSDLIETHKEEKEAIEIESAAERQRTNEALARSERDHEEEKKLMHEAFAAENKMIQDGYVKTLRDNEEEKRAMKVAFATEKKTIQDGHVKTLRDNEEEKRVMKVAFDMEKKTMNENFAARSAGMKSELARSSASLMERDDDKYKAQFFNFSTKPLEDSVLRSMFLELTKLVDDVGRSDWTPNRQLWSHRTLERLCKDRNLTLAVVQRYIVQDCIWYLLYQYIFCSPFRAFGTEGIVLEDQWVKYDKSENTQDGSSGNTDSFFAWPRAQFETERWRYINVTECRNVLRLKLSELDPRGKLKKSYLTQTTKLSKELESSLSCMIEIDKIIRERLDNLRMSAVRLWLEFGMQRCRLRITMHETEMIAVNEKAFQAEHRSIELVASPTLSRQGKANGFELNDRLVLKGCDGELIKLP